LIGLIEYLRRIIDDYWLLVFGICWVLFWAQPIKNRRTGEPMSRKDRLLVSLIGFIAIIGWYTTR
jgi:hypothetical protein